MTRRRPSPIPTATLALLLGGCVTAPPPRPAATLPQAPPRYEAADSVGAQAAARLPWDRYFADERLRALIRLTLQRNPDLREALARVAQTRAAQGLQAADSLPQLNAGLGAARSRIPAGLDPLGAALLSQQFHAGVDTLGWEADVWGRLRRLDQAALQNYLASDAARQAVRLSLINAVVQTDLALRELEERLQLADQTLASRRESLRIFERRVELGATSRLNLTQVQTLTQQAEALQAQLRQARDAQRHRLAELTGVALPADLPPPTALDDSLLQPLAPGLPSALLLNRPDLLAAEHQLRAEQARIESARAAFLPRISLTAWGGSASPELSSLFRGGSQAWLLAPSLDLPLFDGGRRRSNLSLAEAREDAAVAAYEKAIHQALREVLDALSAQQALREQLRIAAETLSSQRERARLSQLRYEAGAAPYLDVLDAQRELLNAEQQLVQSRRALLSSRASLYAALGGDSAAPQP